VQQRVQQRGAILRVLRHLNQPSARFPGRIAKARCRPRFTLVEWEAHDRRAVSQFRCRVSFRAARIENVQIVKAKPETRSTGLRPTTTPSIPDPDAVLEEIRHKSRGHPGAALATRARRCHLDW